MRELIAKLEAATGPSRALDYQIYLALRPTDDPEEYKNLYQTDPASYWYWMAHQEYTASIDAAVALAERVLPDAEWEISNTGRRPGATVISYERRVREGAYAATPAIALCIAILRAAEESAG